MYKFILFTIIFLSFSLSANSLNTIQEYILQHYQNDLDINKTKLDTRIFNQDNDYAFIETIILDENGKYLSTEHIEDIVFTLCLQRINDSWKVIYDLSRTDVPSDEQIIEIQKSFPKYFPKYLLSNFWQSILIDDNTIYKNKLENFNDGLVTLEDFYKTHRAIYKQRIDSALESDNKNKAINLQLESLKKLENMIDGIIARYKVGIVDKRFLNTFHSYLQQEQYYYELMTNKLPENNILDKYTKLLEKLE